MRKQDKKRRTRERLSPPQTLQDRDPAKLGAPAGTPPRALADGLDQAAALARRERWGDAAGVLEALDDRYPGREAVLGPLVRTYSELRDTPRFAWAAERLLRVRPRDADLRLALAFGYLTTIRLALAHRQFRYFLERWPEHPRAAEVRETLARLEPELETVMAETGLAGEERHELAALHEEMQLSIERRQTAAARSLAELLLRRRPDFVPALNNLSLAEATEGLLERAIGTAKRALGLQPENVHALGNLVRFLCQEGRLEEAREWAARLKAAPAETSERWLKKAEAFTYLGDDAEVLAAFAGARETGFALEVGAEGLLHHLAAVAALRQGDEAAARSYWERALELAPSQELPRENLDDLRKPVGKRDAPWPFAMPNWMARSALDALVTSMSSLRDGVSEETGQRAIRRALRARPELGRLVPILLDRGDPDTRRVALSIAVLGRGPELLAALRDFALSQRGPDELRRTALQESMEGRRLPAGMVRFWQEGEWRDLLLFRFDVHSEPIVTHGEPVVALAIQAHDALQDGRAGEAEALLNEALALEPEAPDLLNNLCLAYQRQGRDQEAAALAHRLHAQQPDYLFSRVTVARLALREGKIDEARALLLPLLSRQRLHTSELAVLCQAQMDLLLAEGKPESARQWLEMWRQADPGHPGIDDWAAGLQPAEA